MVPFLVKFGDTDDIGVVDFKVARKTKKQYMSLMVPKADWQRYNIDWKSDRHWTMFDCTHVILGYLWDWGSLEEHAEALAAHYLANKEKFSGIRYIPPVEKRRADGTMWSTGDYFEFDTHTTPEEGNFFLSGIGGSLRVGY